MYKERSLVLFTTNTIKPMISVYIPLAGVATLLAAFLLTGGSESAWEAFANRGIELGRHK